MQAKYLLMLRGVLAEILLLHVLYAPAERAWSHGSLWALLTAYGFAAGAIHWAAKRFKIDKRWLLASFFVDIAMTSAVLIGTADVGSDLYIAYFLVILTSCMQESLAYSFIIGGVSCVVYGALAFPGSDWLSQPFYLLHTSLLMLTAFFSAYVATTAKRVESDLEERFEQKVAWMQRLSWVGQALSAVLHEVRTPLNTVMLSGEYARRCVDQGRKKEAAEQLDIIHREVGRAVEIVSNYLEFAQPSELSLAPLDLRAPLRNALDAIAVWCADRDVTLDVDLGEEIRVDGSERHLTQVFSNVMMNAIEAMPLGGKLQVRLSREKNIARVAVRDTGVGLSPEMTSRLFKPFHTSKDDYEGHGLGLSIARWIVQKHHGLLSITSPGKGQGTTVAIDFPMI